MARCFVALDLSPEIKKELWTVTRFFTDKQLIDAKFVEKHNLHLTLKFLGEIDEQMCGKIQNRLSLITLSPFKVKFGNLGIFTQQQPRALWASLESTEIYNLVR